MIYDRGQLGLTLTLTNTINQFNWRIMVWELAFALFRRTEMSYEHLGLSERLETSIRQTPTKRLDAICKELRIDRHTALRALHQFSGMSFRELQRRALVHKATRYLIGSPSLSLKEIASIVGYGSEATFSHFIKRALGVTPREYRLLHQKQANRRRKIHSAF